MNDPKINKLLQEIERKAAKDFTLLEECGAEYFSTSDLLEMRGKWREQTRIYAQVHKVAIILAASSPIWVAIGCLFMIVGTTRLAFLSLFMVPVSIVVFGGLLFWLKRQFKGQSHLAYIGRLIETELTHRKDATARKRQQ